MAEGDAAGSTGASDGLDSPLRLRCGLVLPNRMAVAPLTNRMSHPDGRASDADEHFHRARADGGFGFIETCAACVHPEGKAWPGQLGVFDDAQLPGLRRVAAAAGSGGGAGVVQLHHGGTMASLSPRKISASAGDGVLAATPDDLEAVQRSFVAAAVRACEAGFAGVELHGANGYLFTQFLAPLDNRRTDAWGGDLAGRAKLLRDCLRAVRAAVPGHFAVGVRISPVDVWSQRGLVLEDSTRLVSWLYEDGADWVHLSLSDGRGVAPHEPDAGRVCSVIREALPPACALLVAGGIWTREQASELLDLGADVVVLGRAAIAHAHWPRESREPNFSPRTIPWTRGQLRAESIGEDFLEYLDLFPGHMVGGKPPRS